MRPELTLTLMPSAPQLTISTSRVGMGVTGGVPYGFDLGTKAGSPGGPFIEGINQGVVGMQARPACAAHAA